MPTIVAQLKPLCIRLLTPVVQCVKLTTRKLIRSTRVCGADDTILLVCAITLHASLGTFDSFIFPSETIPGMGKVKYISSTWFFLSFLIALLQSTVNVF